MKSDTAKRVFSVLLCLVLMAAVLLPMSAIAYASDDNEDVLAVRNSVVRIVLVGVNADESVRISLGYGSGFFVGEAGKPVSTVVTNRHVIEDYYTYYQMGDPYVLSWTDPMTGRSVPLRLKLIVLVDDQEFEVKKVTPSVIEGADLALIELYESTTKRQPVVLGDTETDVKVTDTIYVVGFPGYSDIFTDEFLRGVDVGNTIYDSVSYPSRVRDMSVTKGTIGRLGAPNLGVDTVQYDANAAGGNSGGPVVTESGYVIAIHTFGEDEGQGHWGIDVKYLKNLLKQNEIAFLSSSDVKKPAASTSPATPSPKPQAPVSNTTPAPAAPTPAPAAPTPAPAQETKTTNTGMILGIVAAVIVAAVVAVLLVASNNKKKAAAAKAAKAAEAERARLAEVERLRLQEQYQNQRENYTVPVTNAVPSGKIRITAGTMKGAEVPANDGETIWVGKDAKSCSIVFDPNKFTHVSRMHCSVTYSASDNKYYVTDNSSNGTIYRDGRKKMPRGVRVAVNPGTELLLARDDAAILLE